MFSQVKPCTILTNVCYCFGLFILVDNLPKWGLYKRANKQQL